jgi:hypothetical protein
MQDTTRQKILILNDSLKGHSSASPVATDTVKKVVRVYRQPAVSRQITDTVTDNTRDILSGVTISDSTSYLRNLGSTSPEGFPFTFIEKNRETEAARHEILIRSLRDGEPRPGDTFRADWTVGVMFLAAVVLAVVRSVSPSLFRSVFRMVFMRGINENGSRDTGSLFLWQSTLMNLSSFISVSIFCFLAFTWAGAEIPGVGRFVSWLICFAVVIAAVTLRHIVCNITGSISDEQEIFREYIMTVYQGYRLGGFIFLLISFVILYSDGIPDGPLFISGVAIAGLLYVLRVLRLIFIFITRHVSILYLILYLCALEILPVVITVKYLTALV